MSRAFRRFFRLPHRVATRIATRTGARVVIARAQPVVAAAVVASLLGCAQVMTLEGERLALRSPEFRDYVERVFREQNRIASELAFAYEDAVSPARLDALEAAEAALIEACAGLNELASRRRDGDTSGGLTSLRAARAAPVCEAAAAEAETMIAAGSG